MDLAYYNEIDPYAAQWLRNLIAAGHIAPGVVDEKDIRDVRPGELAGFTQHHFFAGIGVWSYALRQSGWPDSRPVWTGSCPCQPFSAAGAGGGFTDERHLWPAWFHLIGECRPKRIYGEQVEAAIRHGWIDLVQSDLEGIGYACGRTGIPAAGVGAPHIRQRLWFVADAGNAGLERRRGVSERSAGDKIPPGREGGLALKQATHLAGWPTPTVGDSANARNSGAARRNPQSKHHSGTTLVDAVMLVGPARLTVSGEMLTGSSARMDAGGQLNPGLARWLMSLPPEWDLTAPPPRRARGVSKATATRSVRKRP
jgi:DNA (cytosine-5)-methyltransferase 1